MSLNDVAFNFTPEFQETEVFYKGVTRIWIEDEGTDAGKLKAEYRDGRVQDLGYASDYFYAKENGYEGTILQWINTLISSADNAQAAENSKNAAAGSATAADNSAKDSEAYAVGTRNSIAVSSDDPAYHNNSKYYADQAAEEISSFNQAFGNATTVYQNNTSGTTHPSGGTWTSAPSPEKGKYTWAKTSFTWDGGTVDLYNVSYMGEDGAGLVESVNGKEGVVVLYGSDITVSDQDNRTVLQAFSDVIDDTAGTGDYDSTWSASKIKGAIDNKANKSNATFTNSVSMGRDESSTVAPYSSAIGRDVVASGASSHAEGRTTTASGSNSHAEGQETQATAMNSHAEGSYTVASGTSSHAEGSYSQASGNYSHAQGYGTTASGFYSFAAGKNTTANGSSQFAFGKYNVPDLLEYPEWVSGTSYEIGDKVQITDSSTVPPFVTYYECIEANSDTNFTASKWQTTASALNSTHLEVVGNGTDSSHLSNARALDQNGNEYLKGKLYIQANTDSTGGYEVAKASDIPDISGKADKPSTSFTDEIALYNNAGNLARSEILLEELRVSNIVLTSNLATTNIPKGTFFYMKYGGNGSYALCCANRDIASGTLIYSVTSSPSTGDAYHVNTYPAGKGIANILNSAIASASDTASYINDYITLENIPVGTYTSQSPYTYSGVTGKGQQIKSDMRVIHSTVSDYSCLAGDITINTYNGSLDLIGEITGIVTIELDVAR